MQYISIIIILISLIAGITVYFTSRTPFYLKTFPVFLLGCLFTDIYGRYLHSTGQQNVYLYNLFSVYSFTYYLYVLQRIVQNRKVKRILLGIAVLFPILSILIISTQSTDTFSSTVYTIGSLAIIIIGIYYFFELFQLKHAINLAREPAFWICCGLLFFYCCSFPLLGLANYLYRLSPLLLENLTFILSFLNVLLYSLFTIGFLCRLRFHKPAL